MGLLSKVGLKVGECQEVWHSSCIFRRDSKSCRTNHLFAWSNKQFYFAPLKYDQDIFEYVLSSESKKHAKNKVELLQTNDEMFPEKEFSNHLTESVKSKKSSKKVFLKIDYSKKSFPSGSSFQ